MNRKLQSDEEYVAIILEMLHGDGTAMVICARHLVSVTQVLRWFGRFTEEDTRLVMNVTPC